VAADRRYRPNQANTMVQWSHSLLVAVVVHSQNENTSKTAFLPVISIILAGRIAKIRTITGPNNLPLKYHILALIAGIPVIYFK
jgi:hypothetical protein